VASLQGGWWEFVTAVFPEAKGAGNRSRDLSPLCLPAAVGVAYDREP
jgi:hypothetical protein